MQDLKEVLKVTFLALLVIAILTVGITALNGQLYPWWLSIQRKSVEQSKSFTDGNNNMLESYVLEVSRLDTKIAEAQGDEAIIGAYKAQQKAIVGKMCRQISTMAQGTVNPNTTQFLNSHGGCK